MKKIFFLAAKAMRFIGDIFAMLLQSIAVELDRRQSFHPESTVQLLPQ